VLLDAVLHDLRAVAHLSEVAIHAAHHRLAAVGRNVTTPRSSDTSSASWLEALTRAASLSPSMIRVLTP